MHHSGAGVKGTRALAKAKLASGRPEWTDDRTDTAQHRVSEAELAAKKVQRTSKHLDEAKAELHFKAAADKLDARERSLTELETNLRKEQAQVQFQAQATMQKQAHLNKLYENIEKDLHRNLTKERELEALEARLRDQEIHVADMHQSFLECTTKSEANTKLEEQLKQREQGVEFKEKELVIKGERLAMQELHLSTVERQLDQMELEMQCERDRLKHLHDQEIDAWKSQKEAEEAELCKARDELQLFEIATKDQLQQMEIRIRDAELRQANDRENIDRQVAAVHAQTALLLLREHQVNLQEEDVLARELRLITIRNEWNAAQEEKTASTRALQVDLKARERRLQIFASDVEAQVEVTATKQKALDAKLHELAQLEQSLAARKAQ